jgi:hypothetical protein
LINGILTDLTRSRSDLIVENALLHQQLIVLNRQVKRPHLTKRDRFRLVLLDRCTQFWKQALHIVQPDTLLRWNRELFRFYWRLGSKSKQNKPKISPETIELIRKMAKENRLWGADRLRSVQAILRLGESVGPQRLEAACARAVYYGDVNYRRIKAILNADLDREPLPDTLPLPPSQSHTFARPGAEFFTLQAEVES